MKKISLILPLLIFFKCCVERDKTEDVFETFVRVEDIIASSFYRVEGPTSASSVLEFGPEGSWFEQYVTGPTVDYDGEQYRMWFVGSSLNDSVPYGTLLQVGLATSYDGYNWEIANDGQPVLKPGPPGSFDDAGVAHPFVLRVQGGGFLMWYGCIDGTTASDLGIFEGTGLGHVRIERVGLAYSEDGINWTKYGQPVLDIGPLNSIDNVQSTGVHIIETPNGYKMFYQAYNGAHTIATATSVDGVNWEKDTVLLSGLYGLEQNGITVYYDGFQYLMFYGSKIPGPAGGVVWTLFGAISTDGINWEPVFNNEPLLSSAPFDHFAGADGVRANNQVGLPSEMIFVNDTIRIWYSGESNYPTQVYPSPQRIGLMEASIYRE